MASNKTDLHMGLSPARSSNQSARSDASKGAAGYGGCLCGRVIRVDPANNTVDISLANGGILHSVPVIQGLAGSTEGEYGLPNIKTPPRSKGSSGTGTSQQEAGTSSGTNTSNQDDSDGRVDWKDIQDSDLDNPTDERDTYAAVVFMNSNVRTPICIGFLPPLSTQLSIKGRQNTKEDRIDYMRRLTSGWYELSTRGGVYEDNYPDGTHLRVGKPNTDTTTSSEDDYYDDKSDDPDGRIILGQGQYENIDKSDKPWKVLKTESKFRWVLTHSSKAKFGFTEDGIFFFQNTNRTNESTVPPIADTSGAERVPNRINVGDQDAHQTRLWRSGWGEFASPPLDTGIGGEHIWDSTKKRDRFYLPADEDAGTAASWATYAITAAAGGKTNQTSQVTGEPTSGTGNGTNDSPTGSLDAAAHDHVHSVVTAHLTDIHPVGTASAGTSLSLARGDHVHGPTSSDERLKTNLGTVQYVLSALRELNVIRFTWNELAQDTDKEVQVGLLAQQVNLYFPELIREDVHGYLTLDYQKLSALLVQGLKETNDRIDRIERQLGIQDGI